MKTILGAAAALMLSIAAFSQPASAACWNNGWGWHCWHPHPHWYWHHHRDWDHDRW